MTTLLQSTYALDNLFYISVLVSTIFAYDLILACQCNSFASGVPMPVSRMALRFNSYEVTIYTQSLT